MYYPTWPDAAGLGEVREGHGAVEHGVVASIITITRTLTIIIIITMSIINMITSVTIPIIAITTTIINNSITIVNWSCRFLRTRPTSPPCRPWCTSSTGPWRGPKGLYIYI